MPQIYFSTNDQTILSASNTSKKDRTSEGESLKWCCIENVNEVPPEHTENWLQKLRLPKPTVPTKRFEQHWSAKVFPLKLIYWPWQCFYAQDKIIN